MNCLYKLTLSKQILESPGLLCNALNEYDDLMVQYDLKKVTIRHVNNKLRPIVNRFFEILPAIKSHYLEKNLQFAFTNNVKEQLLHFKTFFEFLRVQYHSDFLPVDVNFEAIIREGIAKLKKNPSTKPAFGECYFELRSLPLYMELLFKSKLWEQMFKRVLPPEYVILKLHFNPNDNFTFTYYIGTIFDYSRYLKRNLILGMMLHKENDDKGTIELTFASEITANAQGFLKTIDFLCKEFLGQQALYSPDARFHFTYLKTGTGKKVYVQYTNEDKNLGFQQIPAAKSEFSILL